MKKTAKTTTIRKLPPEWFEFREIALSEGLSANAKLKKMIIEIVEKSKEN